MENIELKMIGTLRSVGKDSLSITLPIEVVRGMKLSAGQQVVIETGDFGILIVPIREAE